MFKSRKLQGLVSSRKVFPRPHSAIHHVALPLFDTHPLPLPGISVIFYLGIFTTVGKGDAPASLSTGGELLGTHRALSLLPCYGHCFLTLCLSSPGVMPHHEDVDILSWDASTHRVAWKGGETSSNLPPSPDTALKAAHAMLSRSGWLCLAWPSPSCRDPRVGRCGPGSPTSVADKVSWVNQTPNQG